MFTILKCLYIFIVIFSYICMHGGTLMLNKAFLLYGRCVYTACVYIYLHAILYRYHAVSLFLSTCGWAGERLCALQLLSSMEACFLYPLFFVFCIIPCVAVCRRETLAVNIKWKASHLYDHNMIDSVKF